MRNFDAARDSFNRVVNDYPKSRKVPDALLKLGFIDYELAKWKKARESLTIVIKRFPDSGAAQLAEVRLKRMRSEKH